jgi:ribonuclease Z
MKSGKNKYITTFQDTMEIIFLGTSCMVPTKERNHQGIFITIKDEGILIDCGEGTQRQLKIAKIKPTRINRIFLTHWHGDHVLGLPGLLQTLNASEYEGKLFIYGPQGTRQFFEHMFKAFSFTIQFEHEIVELSKSHIELKEVFIDSDELKHSIKTLGYCIREIDRRRIKLSYIKKLGIPQGPLLGELQNNKTIIWNNKKIHPSDATYIVKGKKLSIILDTLPCKEAYDLSQDADLLICEASYASDHLDKAEEYKHMTARQAGQLASQSNVRKLILTHFSQRYKTAADILDDAKEIFPNTLAAYDFMKQKL